MTLQRPISIFWSNSRHGDSLLSGQPVSTTLPPPRISLCMPCHPQVSIHPGVALPDGLPSFLTRFTLVEMVISA